MQREFRITRTSLIFLLLNFFVLGGCIVLMLIRGPNGPLILLTVGTIGIAAGKIVRGFKRQKPVANKDAQGSDKKRQTTAPSTNEDLPRVL